MRDTRDLDASSMLKMPEEICNTTHLKCSNFSTYVTLTLSLHCYLNSEKSDSVPF